VSARAVLHRFSRDDSGATAVELAFVLPILVVLLFGTFQFGLAQHRLSSIRYAMNMSSRAVMLNPAMTEAQVEALVKSKLEGIADPNVNVTMLTITTAQGKVARLTGVYTGDIGVPMLATFPVNFQTTVETTLPSA